MIRTLEDAQAWHQAVKKLAQLMKRLADRHWSESQAGLTLGETIFRDDKLRTVEESELQDLAERVLQDLDDLAVLLIFSVFEAGVRDRAAAELEQLALNIPQHPILDKALNDVRERIEHGSFGRLTEDYGTSDADLRTQVNQVRHYRNWVAHGRRGHPTNSITPMDALARLQRFLRLLEAAPPTDLSPP